MIMRTFMDEAGRKRYIDFKAVIRRDQDPKDDFDLATLTAWTPENAAQFGVIKNQLNDYELVALGIRRGLFGERFYKRWFHNQFTKDYEQVHKLIDELQKERPTHFTEYSRLYRRWMRKKHPDADRHRVVWAWWGITGQFDKIDQARTSMRNYQDSLADGTKIEARLTAVEEKIDHLERPESETP